ncbi:MAG: PHP domain-containing protein [Chitinivibrionales bacterium]|nr:PHP domain-containing protein [Chitinivibrionales bacterium]
MPRISRRKVPDMSRTHVSNSHIHTPYSFSCFDSIEQAVSRARNEQVRILGISDFNTIEGHQEFSRQCEEKRVYPLYNIEFIAFSPEDKERGLRWNDPKNPGTVYFCGKALNNPSSFSKDSKNLLSALWKATQDHIWRVIEKTNEYLKEVNIPCSLDYSTIRTEYARNTVRERHVAKALYHAFARKWNDPSQLLEQYRVLFRDNSFSGNPGNSTAMQNEIRSRLLKAGKPAFVEEKREAFLPLRDIRRMILDGGGIPCYPVLTDDSIGLTEYEQDVPLLIEHLRNLRVHAVEFIPARNSFEHLKSVVKHFHKEGFIVTFGTEHNTPEMVPLAPAARNRVPLDNKLMQIGYTGACILAAHQEQHKKGYPGFVDGKGKRLVSEKEMKSFAEIGEHAINEFIGR